MASARRGPVTHANGCHISVSSDIYSPPPPLQPPPHPPRPSLQGRQKGSEAFRRRGARPKRPPCPPPAHLVPLPPVCLFSRAPKREANVKVERRGVEASVRLRPLCSPISACVSFFLATHSAGRAVDHHHVTTGFKNRREHRHKNVFPPFFNSINLNARYR